jgi:hypothetical protein
MYGYRPRTIWWRGTQKCVLLIFLFASPKKINF